MSIFFSIFANIFFLCFRHGRSSPTWSTTKLAGTFQIVTRDPPSSDNALHSKVSKGTFHLLMHVFSMGVWWINVKEMTSKTLRCHGKHEFWTWHPANLEHDFCLLYQLCEQRQRWNKRRHLPYVEDSLIIRRLRWPSVSFKLRLYKRLDLDKFALI